MKKYIYALLGIPIIAIILEIIPFGAVLIFPMDEHKQLKMFYSYFSLTPYGYGNIGPFITAILSCLLLALTIIFILTKNSKLKVLIIIMSALAFATSFMPLLFGIEYFTVLGAGISVVLAVEFILLLVTKID